jgi:FkbM family methyltransferase
LCANLALNQCRNVQAQQVALAAHSGETRIPALNPRQRNNFGGVSLRGSEGGERTPVTALDDLNLKRCDFIKADVEGMEAEILHGAEKTLGRCRPVLYVENDRQEKSPALIELLAGMHYRLWWHVVPLFNPDNFHGEEQDVFGNIVSLNMLCVPREREMPVSGLPEVAGPQDWWFDRAGFSLSRSRGEG